jgi:hypothetical protein
MAPITWKKIGRRKIDRKILDCERFDITLIRVRNSEVFGDRDYLLQKLRAGWGGTGGI